MPQSRPSEDAIIKFKTKVPAVRALEPVSILLVI